MILLLIFIFCNLCSNYIFYEYSLIFYFFQKIYNLESFAINGKSTNILFLAISIGESTDFA